MSSSDRDLVSARAIYVDMGYVQWRRFDGLVGRACHLIANGEAMGVIANEHYDEFAAKLQTEIEDECGVKFEGRIVNKKEVRTAKLKQGCRLNEDCKELWPHQAQDTLCGGLSNVGVGGARRQEFSCARQNCAKQNESSKGWHRHVRRRCRCAVVVRA